ncbi:MAG: hypothetical protein R2939_08200 [Kofleriaceae bacterium]
MRAAAAAALVALAVAARPAHAEDAPAIVGMDFTERAGAITVDASVSRLFDRDAFANLDSGFRTTVVIRLWVYRVDDAQPIAFTVLRRSCIYQLWDEVYDLRLEGEGRRRDVRVKTRGEALKVLTSLDDVRVAAAAALPPGALHVLAVVAELNPVSAETLAEVHRWLSQGTGGGLDRGGSFFGSFVSVFVNLKVPEADRVLRLRSQRFFRP